MADESYKEEVSFLSMIRKLSDGIVAIVQQLTNTDNRVKLLEDRALVLENVLAGGGSTANGDSGSGLNEAAITIVYNRIKNDLTEGKIIPLKSHNSDAIKSVTLEEFKADLVKISETVKNDIGNGNALVNKAKDSNTIAGYTIEDIMHEVDVKLSQRYLENGNFLLNKYDVTEANTTRIDMELADNNRAVIISVNGTLDKYKYTMDGNTLVFETPLKVGDYVLVYSFKELQLLNDSNLNRLLGLIENNRVNLLAKVEETMLSSEYIDKVLKSLDDKLDDFSIVDGKVKIEDDALVSTDNGKDGKSDWDLLN